MANLGDDNIPEDINVPFQGQDVSFTLPDFLWAAAAARNRPAARPASGGSVTSHGSAAVFGRVTRCALEEIIQDKVIVQKGDQGTPGLTILVSNRTAATQGLQVKFLGSFHLLSKNAAGENNQKAKHIQDQFVSNLDVAKKLVERLKQYDMTTPFQIQIPIGYSGTVSVNGWED